MCSVAGSYKKEEVEGMLDLMKHRAPDGSGVVQVGDFYMGMGRLAIIDLTSPGLCPIEKDGYTLVFNGELYNYIELRQELEKEGYVFTTHSDSEVLLTAYQAWGTSCLDKFNFMGVFAIANEQGIFFARDIAGEKPLYYRIGNGGYLSFASEAKALQYSCAEFPPASRGFYSFKTREINIEPWWTFTPVGLDADPVAQLESLLGDAVRLRTRAHVPYGLYFSGGIDSTLISTYHDFVHRFTYDDKPDYKVDFLERFPKILWHLDYPVKTFSAYGLYRLAEEAAQKKVKVVLSGEGADELFGGYVRFVPNEFNRKAREHFPSYQALFPYRDMLTEEFNGNMRELLRMGDRMASAWGIENRCPFLDRRIIEFAMSLPMEWKINGFETKVILRELLRRRKPDYQFEEKKGLYCSVNAWLGETNPFAKEKYYSYQKDLWKKHLLSSISK